MFISDELAVPDEALGPEGVRIAPVLLVVVDGVEVRVQPGALWDSVP